MTISERTIWKKGKRLGSWQLGEGADDDIVGGYEQGLFRYKGNYYLLSFRNERVCSGSLYEIEPNEYDEIFCQDLIKKDMENMMHSGANQ